MDAAATSRKPLADRQLTCPVCKDTFTPRIWNQITCPKPLCKRLYHSQKERERKRNIKEQTGSLLKDKQCIICGATFTPVCANQKVCREKACQLALRRDNRRRRRLGASLYESPDAFKEKLADNTARLLAEQIAYEQAKTQVVVDCLRDCIQPLEPVASRFIFPPDDIRHEVQEVAVLMLSDVHIGKKTEGYDIKVYERRLAALQRAVFRITELLTHAYQVDELCICALGDIVDGDSIYKTHPWHLEVNVMKQVWQVGLPTLAGFIASIAASFKKVTIWWLPGNHGRAGKYVAEELNFDTILGEALKLALSRQQNIEFNVVWDWYKVVSINHWKFLLTHGDSIKIHLNLPWYGITQKAMRWAGAIARFDYLLLGNFHVASHITWNDVEVFTNGTFVSHDEYTLRQLGMSARPAQHFFGVHQKHGVSWNYVIRMP